MKKIVALLIILFVVFSCKEKKLKDYKVGVPLPESLANEKHEIGKPDDVVANDGIFKLYKLENNYDEFAPAFDAFSLEIHYSKHYLSYLNTFNKLVVGTKYETETIENILKTITSEEAELKNNAGGYYNHTLFWETLSAKGGGSPKDTLAGALQKEFGGFDNFKNKFKETAQKQFGSGWTWLILDKYGKLYIVNTNNNDSPLMKNHIIRGTPLMNIDLWEHSYYLNFQQKRNNYIDAYFAVLNWEEVQRKYETALKKVLKRPVFKPKTDEQSDTETAPVPNSEPSTEPEQ